MARFLFRIGQSAARHAWRTVGAWLVLLALAGGSFLAFGGTLATTFSIPGTETTRVTDRIVEEMGETSGAAGMVVFEAEDGELTADQRGEISALLEDITELDGVNTVVDPFATQEQREAQAQELAAGQEQIDQARAQLTAGEEQLDAAQQQLDQARAQAEAAGPEALAQIDAQQAQLDAQREQLESGRAELEAQAAQAEAGQRLLDASDGLRTVSEDGSTALASVVFDTDIFNLSEEDKQGVVDVLDAASISGVSIDYSSDLATAIEGLVGPGEIIGVIVAFVALLVMFRALAPAVSPLLSSVIGVGVSVAAAMSFSGAVEMSSVTPVLGLMLGLAVGIDYSLFIMNRHRRHLREGMGVEESIGLANGTAGNAVVFAGSTVIIALLALNVTGISFLGVMGIVGAASVLVAVLAAVTLTPALCKLVGRRILGRRARHEHEPVTPTHSAPMKTSSALIGAVIGVVGLLVVAIPALDLRLGLPDGSSEPEDSTAYRTYSSIEENFGAGMNGPIVVTAALPEAAAEGEEVEVQADIADRLLEIEEVSAVAPAGVSDDRDFFTFQVIPVDGPSSESTENLVNDLRAQSPWDGDIELGVAGSASGNIDISQMLSDALPVYLLVVVGLSFLIMMLVFRSILVPLIATGGFVLSLVAAFGAIVAIYQWGWLGSVFGVHDPGPVLSFAPIIIMGILFGLAMDYQLFLVSGMREAYVHGVPARAAVTEGRRNGMVVVTVAAIIMISVFGGFVFSHLAMVRPLGFGLAVGVLFDAFVVRMLIVPSLMHFLGEKAWWLPTWLDRLLPNVDVEGAALEREHPVPAAAQAPTSESGGW